jgi:acyl transferase domain-containing protein
VQPQVDTSVPRPLRLPALSAAPSAPSFHLLPLSASSLNHLRAYCTAVAEHLRQRPTMSDRELTDLCGTAALHRSRFPFCKAFVATGLDDLASQLDSFASSGKVEAVGEAKLLRVGMVITGQGSQYERNGLDMMESFPVYRQMAQVCTHNQNRGDVPRSPVGRTHV